jgi:murein L,D-transpeptidase YafK
MKRRRLLAYVLLLPLAFALPFGEGLLKAQPSPALKADLVLVFKAERRLELRFQGRTLRSYRIALGGNPLGHKVQEGDQRTPEGLYSLDWRNPGSKYYKSLHVSYPNEIDRVRADAVGVDPGGMIMIHGLPNWYQPGLADWAFQRDWTNGCIAVGNDEMEEIWGAVDDGTPIMIFR